MHAIRIDIDGPSYRQHVAADRATKRKKSPSRSEAPPAEAP
jgi:hypothetical protein